ncbi:MAG: tRNA 2-thiouridine(34) synthase MnmA [Patescibacteria group bacterium]
MKKVAIAMSGGVDSGVAAAILVKQGFDVTAFHMQLWHEKVEGDFKNKCCDLASLEAARKTAQKLKIPFYVVDFSKAFKREVVDYFLKEYGDGRTPNPCVMCNRLIKFGQLLNYVKGLGFDYLATGHYVKIKKNKGFHLLSGMDRDKDQSYFLYNLDQEKLKSILFPLGDLKKKQVVKLAKELDLHVANRSESQEVCFFPESDYKPFLKRNIRKRIIPGKVLNKKGEIIGNHGGLAFYTIGQRHGFEISKKLKAKAGLIPPFYVIGKDVKRNILIVGFGKETEAKSFIVKDLNWINLSMENGLTKKPKCEVKIRHQGRLLECSLKRKGKNVEVILIDPQRGVSPGQAAVFYKKGEVLGGGLIYSH